jgi:type IV secretion system protein VirB4
MAALTPYTLEGAYGRLLDGASEELANADVLHIEMEELMSHKALVPPVLTYLFHRLEARFDRRPTLLILDEAWTFLVHCSRPAFASGSRRCARRTWQWCSPRSRWRTSSARPSPRP